MRNVQVRHVLVLKHFPITAVEKRYNKAVLLLSFIPNKEEIELISLSLACLVLEAIHKI